MESDVDMLVDDEEKSREMKGLCCFLLLFILFIFCFFYL